MGTIFQDVRYGLRTMLKRPGFTLVAVVTLALGIGVNTAIFTVVDAALLRSLPYAEPERLVHLWETKPRQDFGDREASYPDYLDWKQQGGEVFESVGGYTAPGSFTLAGDAPERVSGAGVTEDFFKVLGVRPHVGRDFVEGEGGPGAGARAVMLSHGLWRRRFGSDPKVVGSQITLGSTGYTVVGVLPASFHFAKVGDAELWVPIIPGPMQLSRRYMHWLKVVARLKTGVSVEAAQSRMEAVGRAVATDDPASHAGTSIRLVPLQEEFVGAIKPVLLLLLGAVGFVLLIACANVANLLLARSAARRKEIAVRVALGASRWRLVRQLLTESMLLAALGGCLVLVLALWSVDLLVAAIPAAQLNFMPYLQSLTLSPGVLVFTFALSVVTGLVFGLSPALEASKPDLRRVMSEGEGLSGRSAAGLRNFLVVSEVALALALLVGAGLMTKSLFRMLSVDPGFRAENLLTMKLALPAARYGDDAKAGTFYEELIRRVEALPGVEGAAAADSLPLSADGGTGTPQIIGRPQPETDSFGESHLRSVSAGYFGVMGIPVMKGRGFTDRDGPEAPNVVVVNRTFAERLFPGEDPLGQRITFKFTADRPPFEIVGVVGDEKIISLDAHTTPVIYFPHLQDSNTTMSLVVRAASSDPEGLTAAVRGEVQALDKAIPLYSVTTMERIISDAPATFMRRYPAYLVGIFAGVALVLATIGIYGVISYAVSQRMREIAIRIALGAQKRDVMKLVMRQGMTPAVVGVLLGLLGAFALTRLLKSMLFGVSAADPSVYFGVSALLVFVALVACYVPARRAMKVDPMVALRYE